MNTQELLNIANDLKAWLEECFKKLEWQIRDLQWLIIKSNEYVAKETEKRRWNDPLKDISPDEGRSLTGWILQRAAEKELVLNKPPYNLTFVDTFFAHDAPWPLPSALEKLSRDLDYESFEDLLAAYRKEKGGEG